MASSNSSKSKLLGAGIRTHTGRGITGPDFCLWVLPGLLIPFGLVTAGLYLTLYDYAQGGISAAGQPWLCGGLALLIPIAVLGFRRFRAVRRRITVHEGGLHLVRIGGTSVRLAWDDIAAVRTAGTRRQLFGKPLADRYELTLETSGGRTIRIPERIADLDQLARTIWARIGPRLLSETLDRLAHGDTARFGPIAVAQSGLITGRRTWPWETIDSLRISDGSLVIESAGKRVALPVAEVPNAPLLLDIAARLGPGPRNP